METLLRKPVSVPAADFYCGGFAVSVLCRYRLLNGLTLNFPLLSMCAAPITVDVPVERL
jgi:hypothetical protein